MKLIYIILVAFPQFVLGNCLDYFEYAKPYTEYVDSLAPSQKREIINSIPSLIHPFTPYYMDNNFLLYVREGGVVIETMSLDKGLRFHFMNVYDNRRNIYFFTDHKLRYYDLNTNEFLFFPSFIPLKKFPALIPNKGFPSSIFLSLLHAKNFAGPTSIDKWKNFKKFTAKIYNRITGKQIFYNEEFQKFILGKDLNHGDEIFDAEEVIKQILPGTKSWQYMAATIKLMGFDILDVQISEVKVYFDIWEPSESNEKIYELLGITRQVFESEIDTNPENKLNALILEKFNDPQPKRIVFDLTFIVRYNQ
ncbi:MAG: hypothetical protein H6622_01480 [Halobacteriovoraceae bacterium]|nr:hypothetical protein [Halobacteriovoraceae bacterium]